MDIAAFQKDLVRWYEEHRRDLPWRKTRNPYHIWVSEVMLQQTRVDTVIGYYHRFLEAFPDIRTLAAADLQEVLKRWEGLGYYSRARHLHAAAGQLADTPEKKVPDAPARFKQLPGVGDYINAAVQSIAFDHPLPVVDGNVKRVLSRLFMMTFPVNQAGGHKEFATAAESLLDRRSPGRFNQAVMELGALACKPARPACRICPVTRFCRAFRENRTADFPRRLAGKKVPHHHLAAGAVWKKNTLLIVLRPPEGLLGGLWEFPGGRLKPGETSEAACRRSVREAVGLTVLVGPRLVRIRHAYTHFKITLDLYWCDFEAGRVRRRGPAAHRWIRPAVLEQYPFHRAVHKCLPALYEAAWPVKGPG